MHHPTALIRLHILGIPSVNVKYKHHEATSRIQLFLSPSNLIGKGDKCKTLAHACHSNLDSCDFFLGQLGRIVRSLLCAILIYISASFPRSAFAQLHAGGKVFSLSGGGVVFLSSCRLRRAEYAIGEVRCSLCNHREPTNCREGGGISCSISFRGSMS